MALLRGKSSTHDDEPIAASGTPLPLSQAAAPLRHNWPQERLSTAPVHHRAGPRVHVHVAVTAAGGALPLRLPLPPWLPLPLRLTSDRSPARVQPDT